MVVDIATETEMEAMIAGTMMHQEKDLTRAVATKILANYGDISWARLGEVLVGLSSIQSFFPLSPRVGFRRCNSQQGSICRLILAKQHVKLDTKRLRYCDVVRNFKPYVSQYICQVYTEPFGFHFGIANFEVNRSYFSVTTSGVLLRVIATGNLIMEVRSEVRPSDQLTLG